MAFGNYFDHDRPARRHPARRMRAAGYISSSQIGYEVGENIGWGTLWVATPRAMVAAWMASPGHRANILDAHFRDTGVGVSPTRPPRWRQPGAIYTQDFGVPICGRPRCSSRGALGPPAARSAPPLADGAPGQP